MVNKHDTSPGQISSSDFPTK